MQAAIPPGYIIVGLETKGQTKASVSVYYDPVNKTWFLAFSEDPKTNIKIYVRRAAKEELPVAQNKLELTDHQGKPLSSARSEEHTSELQSQR